MDQDDFDPSLPGGLELINDSRGDTTVLQHLRTDEGPIVGNNSLDQRPQSWQRFQIFRSGS
jgi:hypothetical protein